MWVQAQKETAAEKRKAFLIRVTCSRFLHLAFGVSWFQFLLACKKAAFIAVYDFKKSNIYRNDG